MSENNVTTKRLCTSGESEQSDWENKRLLTGVKPTGIPHIGNYVGAIKPALQMVEDYKESFLFVADYHALNQLRDPEILKEYSYGVTATYLALGLDPEKTALYRQSDVSEIFELDTILTSLTPKGLMNRAHAYKAATDKNKAEGKEGNDLDQDITMGLYTYPILMAADILIAQAEIIPVGKDQIQHLEMTRDIAGSFNHLYKDVFSLPEAIVQEDAEAIPGLDGRKMSKSYDNTIPLFLDSKQRRKMIMKIVTDSALPEDTKDPDSSTIYQLYRSFGTEEEIAQLRADFEAGGMGYGDAKQRLFEAVDRELAEPTEKYNELMADRARLDEILAAGAEKVRPIARETLNKTREALGLHPA